MDFLHNERMVEYELKIEQQEAKINQQQLNIDQQKTIIDQQQLQMDQQKLQMEQHQEALIVSQKSSEENCRIVAELKEILVGPYSY